MSEKLTVAELLARSAKESGGRGRRGADHPRRHRDLEQGGVSVSELTGDIPVVRVDEDGRPTGQDPEYREHDARHGGSPSGDATSAASEQEKEQAPSQAPKSAVATTTGGRTTVVTSDSALVPNRSATGGTESVDTAGETDGAAESGASDVVEESSDTTDTRVLAKVPAAVEETGETGQADGADTDAADAAVVVDEDAAPDVAEEPVADEPAAGELSEPDADEAEAVDEADNADETDTDDATVAAAAVAAPTKTDRSSKPGKADKTDKTAKKGKAAEVTDDEIVEYEDDSISWGALIGQALGAVVLGVLIFFGFTLLWDHLNVVIVLVMALVVTLVVVGLVHSLLRHRDTLILALAFIVGLALTLGPRLIMSI